MRRSIAAAVGLGFAAVVVTASPAAAAKPALEPMYANGSVVYMSAPSAVAAGGVHTSKDFYLIVYPDTFPSTVHPLCDFSCPGDGIPPIRDVVLQGAPGAGTNGTAGSFNPNWHVLVLVYDPIWVSSPSFTPATSETQVDAGETAGHFLPINQGGDNPYELDTGITFLCVLVSSHA